MRLLDLFCGAGGAAVGYARAGFDVVGVDFKPQRHYPFEFIQADALTFPLDGFDVVHASPPCQGYSVANNIWSREHPKLIDAMRSRLQEWGGVWVIENVGGAWLDMRNAITLCGTHFGLKVYRHRLFESSVVVYPPRQCCHPSYLLPGYLSIYGHGARGRQTGNRGNNYVRYGVKESREAMGIEWMTREELSQAIPPAYTEWIGRQLAAPLVQPELWAS